MTQTPGYPDQALWQTEPPADLNYESPRTSRMAIVSLVCGAVGLVAFCTLVPSILGVVLGAAALPPIQRGEARGRGLAIGGIVLGAIGALAGVIIWIVLVQSPPATPIPGREVPQAYCNTLEAMGVLEPDEQIELYYASGPTSVRQGGAVITAERFVLYSSESDIQACRLVDIRAIDFTPADGWFDDGQFIVECDDGTLMIFIVGGQDAGDQLFHRVLRRLATDARAAEGRPPVASEILRDDQED